MIDLIKYSKNIKKEASSLLQESNLLRILSQIGDVSVGGSYDLDLMYDRDLDIFVYSDKITEKIVKNLLNLFIDSNYYWGYKFYDFVKYQSGWGPRSYYIGLKNVFEKNLWKIDVWLFPYEVPSKDTFIEEIKQAKDEQRSAILLLKKYKSEKLDNMLRSYKIYDAVLRYGVKTPSSFQQYLKTHK